MSIYSSIHLLMRLFIKKHSISTRCNILMNPQQINNTYYFQKCLLYLFLPSGLMHGEAEDLSFFPCALPTSTQTGTVTFCLNTFSFLLKYAVIPSPTSSLFSQRASELNSQCLPAELCHNVPVGSSASVRATLPRCVLGYGGGVQLC